MGIVARLQQGAADRLEVLEGALQGSDGTATDPQPALAQLGLRLATGLSAAARTPEVVDGVASPLEHILDRLSAARDLFGRTTSRLHRSTEGPDPLACPPGGGTTSPRNVAPFPGSVVDSISAVTQKTWAQFPAAEFFDP